MKYPFAVKVNGKFYRPNTEIPETVSKVEKVEETPEKVTEEKPKKTAKK